MRRGSRTLRALAVTACAAAAVACSWDPRRPFERESPAVSSAIDALDGGDASAAAEILTRYLETGACEKGNISISAAVKQKGAGSFDLGLALFALGERYGRPFGDEELGDAGEDQAPLRQAEVDCGLRIARAVAQDRDQALAVRARARHLEGNLLFLTRDYRGAVKAYDEALVLAPGEHDGGDDVGRDAAHNRAIALRRIDDQEKDAGRDSGHDSSPPDDSGAPPDSGADSGGSDAGAGDDGGSDSGDDGGGNDGGGDGGPPPPPEPQPNEPPPPPSQSPDDRILDQLENAPTVQAEDAKRRANRRRVPASEDK